MKYFSSCGRWDHAAKFFEPLYEKDPEVAAVLSKAYIGTGMKHGLMCIILFNNLIR